jgi:hypothetical protein
MLKAQEQLSISTPEARASSETINGSICMWKDGLPSWETDA